MVVGFVGVFSPGKVKLDCSLNCFGAMLKPFAIYYIGKRKSIMQGHHVLSETFDICAKSQWRMTLNSFPIKKNLEIRARVIVYP